MRCFCREKERSTEMIRKGQGGRKRLKRADKRRGEPFGISSVSGSSILLDRNLLFRAICHRSEPQNPVSEIILPNSVNTFRAWQTVFPSPSSLHHFPRRSLFAIKSSCRFIISLRYMDRQKYFRHCSFYKNKLVLLSRIVKKK